MGSMHEIYSENTVGIDFSIHARTVLKKLELELTRDFYFLISEQCCPEQVVHCREVEKGGKGEKEERYLQDIWKDISKISGKI